MARDIALALPDGSELAVPAGTTVEEAAYRIGPGLGDDCIAGRVDGVLVDERTRLTGDAALAVVTPGSADADRVHRRTAAVLLAALVEREFPGAEHAATTVEDETFGVDFGSLSLDAGDLDSLGESLAGLVADERRIERRHAESALAALGDGNSYVAERLSRERSAADDGPAASDAGGPTPEDADAGGLAADDGRRLAVYAVEGVGRVADPGPVLASTGPVEAVELLDVSAAYWRGDEANEMLTRVHGTAFESAGDLDAFLDRRSAVARHDHRRLNATLDLFSIPETSPGCAQFHPNGMAVRRELEALVRELNADLGYAEVWTPQLNRAELWERTGHYGHFIEEGRAFCWEQDGEPTGVKPVNCPSHMYLYDRTHRSYRDLPVRYFENVPIYRNEQSGERSGLVRLQAFTQDDGHAFLRPDQVHDEVRRVLAAIRSVPESFGMDTRVELQTDPPAAAGRTDAFERATDELRAVLDDLGWAYSTVAGKGAFYAPKVDCVAEDSVGQEWVLGGVQLDRVLADEFGLTYVDEDGEERRPVVLHRILIGSFERFFAAVVEHFGGDLPLWLAPEQARVLPITDDHLDYAESVEARLSAFRVGVERRPWTLEKQIRTAHDDRVPYMLVVGDREVADGTVSVRDRRERRLGTYAVEDLLDALREEYEARESELVLGEE